MKFPNWIRKLVHPLPAVGLRGLPTWAKIKANSRVDAGRLSVYIEIDTAAAFAEWRDLLGVGAWDQYWLEVAYQCAKLDVQAWLVGSKNDPRTCGKAAEMRFLRAPGLAQSSYASGRGTQAASEGREAREHYKRVRGFLPF